MTESKASDSNTITRRNFLKFAGIGLGAMAFKPFNFDSRKEKASSEGVRTIFLRLDSYQKFYELNRGFSPNEYVNTDKTGFRISLSINDDLMPEDPSHQGAISQIVSSAVFGHLRSPTDVQLETIIEHKPKYGSKENFDPAEPGVYMQGVEVKRETMVVRSYPSDTCVVATAPVINYRRYAYDLNDITSDTAPKSANPLKGGVIQVIKQATPADETDRVTYYKYNQSGGNDQFDKIDTPVFHTPDSQAASYDAKTQTLTLHDTDGDKIAFLDGFENRIPSGVDYWNQSQLDKAPLVFTSGEMVGYVARNELDEKPGSLKFVLKRGDEVISETKLSSNLQGVLKETVDHKVAYTWNGNNGSQDRFGLPSIGGIAVVRPDGVSESKEWITIHVDAENNNKMHVVEASVFKDKQNKI